MAQIQPPNKTTNYLLPVRVIALALAYYLLAKIGLIFAIPPGYATAIWPPSGLALASVMLWGWPMAFGVLLGSFLANADIGNPASLLIPFLIASGSALQAVVGARLVLARSDPPWTLNTLKQAGVLIVVGGPIASLVSASVGNATLYLFGGLAPSGIPANWLNWWLGDSLGVLVFAPILLVVMQKTDLISMRRKLLIAIPALSMFLFLTLVYISGKQQIESELRSNLAVRSQLGYNALSDHLTNKINLLNYIAGLFNVSGKVSREEFHDFYKAITASMSSPPTLTWAPRVAHDDKSDIIAKARAEGLEDYEIFEASPEGPRPVEPRPFYQPLFYIEPHDRHPNAFGFDLRSESRRREAIDRAFSTNTTTSAGPLKIVGSERPTLIYVLVSPLTPLSAGNAVLSIVWIEQMVAPLAELAMQSEVGYRLTDRRSGTVLFTSESDIPPSGFSQTKDLKYLDYDLSLESWLAAQSISTQMTARLAPLVFGGFIIIGAVSLLIISSTGAHQSAQLLVHYKTRELRQEREFLESMIDNLPMLLYIKDAATRRFLRANHASLAAVKDDAPQMIGRTQEEVFGERSLDTDNRSDDKVVFEGEIVNEEAYMELGGEIRWFQNTKVPVLDPETREVKYILGLAEDITHKKLFEREIKDSRQRVSRILENVGEGIYGLDESGNITFVNPAATDLLGFSEEALLGQNAHELFHHHHQDGREFDAKDSPIYDTLTRGETHRVDDQVFWHRDGSALPVEYLSTAIVENEKVIGAVVVFSDISKRLVMDRLQREQTERIQQINEDLEEFSYVASHDLQEPLRTLICFCEFLEDDLGPDLPDDAATDLEYIKQAARRMTKLINDMLDYSRAGSSELELAPQDLNDCVDQIQHDLLAMIRDHDAEITVDPLPTVLGDRNGLLRVFQNLIQNAIRYRSERKPQIRVYEHSNDGQMTTIAVKDNGIGIEAQYLEQIFGAFRRVQSSDDTEGSGIGLAVVKKLVERHRGAVSVDSEPGVGSTFYVTLKLNY
ncbi:PAS domain S-box-containing protein [Litorivivens lipolytica]|uniref:histidine kinase n=1 Tax=Litorivivens lipolytica TaxID=1524264 RepID=A0A7W4W2R9_9GAMM|nr:ATP-binding protein [Litorivivens lipolytica]MBB3046390.1 PAS domain S-box-containing protein [Litorivivens lipolytica]